MNKIKTILNVSIIILLFSFKILTSQEEKNEKQICEISVSPDFSKVALRVIDSSTKENSLYLMNLRKKKILKKLVSTKTSICYFSWDAKGNKIYYRKGRSICVYDLTLSKESPIFIPGKEEYIGLVRLSPDGKYIGFSLKNLGIPSSRKNVWIINIKTKNKKQITKNGLAYWGSWCWKSDREILYSKENEKGIFLTNIKSLREKKLLDGFVLDSISHSVSPDRKILFFFDILSNNYYMVSLSEEMKLLYSGDNKYISSIAWGPRSKNVMFWKQIDCGCQLFLAELAERKIKIKKINKVIRPLPGVKTIEWLSPENILVSASYKTLEIVNINNMKIKRIFTFR